MRRSSSSLLACATRATALTLPFTRSIHTSPLLLPHRNDVVIKALLTHTHTFVTQSSPVLSTTHTPTHTTHTTTSSPKDGKMPEVNFFFSQLKQFVVVGASTDRNKFGNKVLRCYVSHGKRAIPVNKKETHVEGLPCVASLRDVPAGVLAAETGVSVITAPAVTKTVIEEGLALGFRHFFLQPGTVDVSVEEVLAREKAKYGDEVSFIRGCVLVELGCSHE